MKIRTESGVNDPRAHAAQGEGRTLKCDDGHERERIVNAIYKVSARLLVQRGAEHPTN